MRSLRYSPQAREDLIDIWLYVASDSIRAADRFIDRIYAMCTTLADSPGMGRERPEISPGCRGFTVGEYVIFYEEGKDGIVILRVLHGSRDLPPLFGGP